MQRVERHRARKHNGIHCTPPELARFLSSQMVTAYRHHPADHAPVILDPAIGDGQLAATLAAHLRAAGAPPSQIHGFDTDPEAVRKAGKRLESLGLPGCLMRLEHADFLQFARGYSSPASPPELFERSRLLFDMVIANPPYVRTQVMGAMRAQELAKTFGLSGRVDLYHAFIPSIARVLQPGGHAALIVSNRFMTTRTGAAVRAGILESFDVLHVWDLGDTKLFEAAVLPALLLLRRKGWAPAPRAGFTAIYQERASTSLRSSDHVLEALGHEGLIDVRKKGVFRVRQGTLDHSGSMQGVWRLGTEKDREDIRSVATNTALTFGDIGRIRVGVKTCADRVFIRRDWDVFPPGLRPELLRPLTTHRIARRFKPAAERDNAQILYPHAAGADGRIAVDLRLYPKSAAYLEKHRGQLERRRYLIESGRRWYEIWVPQNPALWDGPKLVFRDIADSPVFWIDNNGTIVNGDCYWIHPREDRKELLWLAAAVGNSSFAGWFYDTRFNNRLYAGRRRFMAQYVEEFPLPGPERPVSRKIIALARRAYDLIGAGNPDAMMTEMDELVWQAFGLKRKEAAR